MKMDFNRIVCLGLVAFVGGLSAQEAPTEDSREIAMSCGDRCNPTPPPPTDDCCGCGPKQMRERQPREEKYDYDVYTTGERNENECETPKRQERPKRTTQCGESCHRKGAAKAAQQ